MMSSFSFTKMHGCGNDFIVVNAFAETFARDLSKLAQEMCQRRFAVGADQFIILGPAESSEANFCMDILNADGSKVEMCGNALRCAAVYAQRENLVQSEEIKIETMTGISHASVLENGDVRIAVAIPSTSVEDLGLNSEQPLFGTPLSAGQFTFPMTGVSVGNPHAVTYVDEVDLLELEKIGPLFEHHEVFKNRANIEFVKVIDDHHVKMRVWERGSGETLACGSGACAVAVASILHGVAKSPMTVSLKGGDLLIEWQGRDTAVYMSGSATFVFDATWTL